MQEGVKTENDHINLKVAGQDGSVVQFKIKRHTPLSKLMKAYCERQVCPPAWGLGPGALPFRASRGPLSHWSPGCSGFHCPGGVCVHLCLWVRACVHMSDAFGAVSCQPLSSPGRPVSSLPRGSCCSPSAGRPCGRLAPWRSPCEFVPCSPVAPSGAAGTHRWRRCPQYHGSQKILDPFLLFSGFQNTQLTD